MNAFVQVFFDNRGELLEQFLRHLSMTSNAVFIAIMAGVPVGIAITRNKTASGIVIGIANIMQSIPCIALLAFSIPLVGIGEKAAILMVIVYALLPIIKNTFTGISGVPPTTLEVARGLGLSHWQQLFVVKLPMAAPYIMSGIRIAAVAAVGTMTIAAFAGAEGLGWFINLGLNSSNIPLVLLGAIPASLLALAVDFLLGRLEHAVTSEGLFSSADQIKNEPVTKRRRELLIISVLCASIVLAPLGTNLIRAASARGQKTITVGCANFTESLILGYVYSELIEENTDIKVQQKFGLSSASFCFNSLQSGELDMFTEYTGTALSTLLNQPLSTDPEEVYNTVATLMHNEHEIETSYPLGFNNTYVMSVTPETAEKYGLVTLSDLMKISNKLTLGCTVEFIDRADCLSLLKSTFSTDFSSVKGLDSSIRYKAIEAGEVDVVDAFSTDALLSKLGLTMLKDDVRFFPPYYCVNFTREDTLFEYPELGPILSKLDGLISEDEMAAMNSQVDIDGKDAKEVAHEFLLRHGLVH